jgi:hypothetical protein
MAKVCFIFFAKNFEVLRIKTPRKIGKAQIFVRNLTFCVVMEPTEENAKFSTKNRIFES